MDAENDRACVRYERGQKGEDKEKDSGRESALPHVVRAKNPNDLINKLCRYYRNACGNTSAEIQWKAFLDCAIYYLYRDCKPEEFNLESLRKLAETTHRRSGQSAFERMARRSFYVSRGDLSRLNDVYSEWMKQREPRERKRHHVGLVILIVLLILVILILGALVLILLGRENAGDPTPTQPPVARPRLLICCPIQRQPVKLSLR